MGLRLAQEVVSFVKRKLDKASRVGILSSITLSFMGHSIGNIIIRTTLAEAFLGETKVCCYREGMICISICFLLLNRCTLGETKACFYEEGLKLKLALQIP